MEHLLVIDNYDSFTWNLVQLFANFPIRTTVVRNDALSLEDLPRLAPTRILVGPGPADPSEAGISKAIIKGQSGMLPILGVCLGMQCMAEVFGGHTVTAPRPVHGKTDAVFHDGTGLFANIPDAFKAARYHSLCVTLSKNGPLAVTARTKDGVPMAIAHKTHPTVAVQFHPESYLSQHGHSLAENFLQMKVA